MTDDAIKLELAGLRKDLQQQEKLIKKLLSTEDYKTGQKSLRHAKAASFLDVAERLGRVESKLWWIQGILCSTGEL
jgi:hypothetical protein